MDSIDYTTALKEIAQGTSFEMSSIEPKSEANRLEWLEIEREYLEQQEQFG